jgi:hypothetical protein
MSTHANTQAGSESMWIWTPLVVIAAMVIALASLLSRSEMRVKGEQLKAQQIDQENHLLCERLGMSRGSEKFALCIEVLSETRRRQAERLASEIDGF